ncbi:aminoglycoside phosphotransferase family protein [Candidatus Aalborgicola defluviihabitans]|uniref:aminoglycoside phosphotransferase family protein n=1 Tax=Candidatus Aalborgicola defluviihabitans TaxID=3386187 RepID=UPI00390BA4FC|nr:phosphotransferase [Burkholderiales bacterium]
MSPTASPTTPPAPLSTLWSDPQRQALLATWLAGLQSAHGLVLNSVRLASADASFRRYLRVERVPPSGGGSLVIMDAPPDKENCQPFVHVAGLMAEAGLKAPQVLAWDEANGFMLLTDLGTQTMMQVINPTAAPPLTLYLDAVETLVQWQKASREGVLPPYDRPLLLRELELFPQWYIAQHRQFTLDAAQRKTLDDAFEKIITANLSWPSVFVHRDFMPRNLMVQDVTSLRSSLPLTPGLPTATRLGVLDFQDAVYGPITYDIASLMRDAFLSWDEDFCLDVTIRYWEKARKAGLPVGDDFGEFYKGVEWMGLQRHLKVAGIFARLTLRDGKPQYLADTPRFIDYIRATCSRYMELKPLLRLVERIEGIAVPNAYAFGRS